MRFRKATFNFSIHDSQRSILLRAPVLYESDDEVDEVYFPLSGMISLLVVMRDGKAIETATVGRQGVVGAMSLDPHTSKLRAIAQLPMHANRLLASQLRTAAVSSKPIVELCFDTMRCCSIMRELLPLAMLSITSMLGFADGFYRPVTRATPFF
jgi:CRP-like cAMP-binding protein